MMAYPGDPCLVDRGTRIGPFCVPALGCVRCACRCRSAARRTFYMTLCRARTRTLALCWRFLGSLRCPRVLVDQAVDDLSALDPGGHIDGFAGLVQRRSLLD